MRGLARWGVTAVVAMGCLWGAAGCSDDPPRDDVDAPVPPPTERPTPPDGGLPDAGAPDAGVPDAGAPDAGTPDAGPGGSGRATSYERTLGLRDMDVGNSVAIAPGGDVFVASSHAVDLPDFGAGRQPARGNVALSRFAPDGTHVWTYAEVDEGNCGPGGPCTLTDKRATAAAADATGRSALGVETYEEGKFGEFGLKVLPRIVVLDAQGQVLWARDIRGPGGDGSLEDLGFDAAGNLYAAGSIRGPGWDFGDGQTRGTEFLPGAFLASYSPQGALRWVRLFADARATTRAFAMAVEADGGLVFVGDLAGRYDFGGGELVGNEDGRMPDRQTYVPPRIFVLRLGPEGAHRWSRLLAPTEFSEVNDVALGTGGVVLGGYFETSMTFGGRKLTARNTEGGSQDGFVAVMGPGGEERWATPLASGMEDEVFGVGWDPSGDVWAAGGVWDGARLGATPVPDAQKDTPQLVLGRLRGADGQPLSVTSPRKGIQEGDLAVDARGTVVLTGGVIGPACGDRCEPVELYLRQQVP